MDPACIVGEQDRHPFAPTRKWKVCSVFRNSMRAWRGSGGGFWGVRYLREEPRYANSCVFPMKYVTPEERAGSDQIKGPPEFGGPFFIGLAGAVLSLVFSLVLVGAVQINHSPSLVQFHRDLRPFRDRTGFHFQPLQWEDFFAFRSLELDCLLHLADID